MTAEAMVKPLVQIAVGAAIIFAITYIAGAFTEPAAGTVPPDNNTPPPLNESTNPQWKDGFLWLRGGLTVGPETTGEFVPQYFQIDVVSRGLNPPEPTDCNEEIEIGRMYYDASKNLIEVCTKTVGIIAWKGIEPQPIQ
ncbi:MAG: hypothetical protein HYT22_02940 [Candidatus Niyogibacteria bacterium]|nr:hypothetical protein [Candidatus Niyogibacteria bacterium]